MPYNAPTEKTADTDTFELTDYNILRQNWLASALAIVTTKGDMVIATAANALARLGVGNFGDMLTPDSGETTGLKWQIQPACRVYRSGSYDPSVSSWDSIPFTDERFDTNGMHSTSSNTSRITIPTNGDGLYHVTGNVVISSLSLASGAHARLRILLNGATVIAQQNYFADSAGSVEIALNVSTIYDLDADDYLELQVYVSKDVDIAASGNVSPEFAAAFVRPN